MKKIITIGREYGSGGHEIAEKVAKNLGYKLYDKKIIEETALKNGISEELVSHFDEKPISKLDLSMKINAIPIIEKNMLLEQQIFLAQKEIMIAAAQIDDCVFIGRCSDYIFKDYNSLNFFIISEFNKRLERKMSLLNKSEKEIKKEIILQDKKRSAYYNFYTGKQWRDPINYDCMINSGQLGIEKSVDMIINIAKIK